MSQSFSDIIWIIFQVGVVEGGFKSRCELCVLVVPLMKQGWLFLHSSLQCKVLYGNTSTHSPTKLLVATVWNTGNVFLCYNTLLWLCSITAYGCCLWSTQGHAAYDFTANVQKDWAIPPMLFSLKCLVH